MYQGNQQKMKILYLARYLQEYSDKMHPVAMADILSHLKKNDISAERKSVYTDMETLRLFGMDIQYKRGKPSGYYLANREFALAELKLLVDAVQSSKFITLTKTRELIHKLEGLAGIHAAKQLQRQVFVLNRVKTMNEGVYHLVDRIHEAISSNVVIEFHYVLWLPTKEMVLRKEGKLYKVSPFSLVWEDENYYLIGYDHSSKSLKHYRVDKMQGIRKTKQSREGKEWFQKFDVDDYVKKSFGMYGGEEAVIKLKCENKLAGVMIDRFGRDIMMHPMNKEQFIVILHVRVSEPFFGWLAGLGNGVVIVSPEDVSKQFVAHMQSILQEYK